MRRLRSYDGLLVSALSLGSVGGITFSGGEPTVQAQALIPLCRQLKEEGIHICLDTQGSIRNAYVDELLSIVDMVLLDCKHVLPEGHRRLTNSVPT